MDIQEFYEMVADAMDEKDSKQWWELTRKYHKYFKQHLEDYGRSNFEWGRDTNLDFLRAD